MVSDDSHLDESVIVLVEGFPPEEVRFIRVGCLPILLVHDFLEQSNDLSYQLLLNSLQDLVLLKDFTRNIQWEVVGVNYALATVRMVRQADIL